MAAPENAKVGVCYIWFISLLLFIFTVSGAAFLVLYMIQPSSATISWYPIIGVSLVCFPWIFWSLTILYRIVSRACGFRMICFGPFGADHPDDTVPSGGAATNNGSGGSAPIHNVNDGTIDGNGGGNFVDTESGDRNVNRASGVGAQPRSPKRVHFGGVVIIGEDDDGAHGNQGSPKPLSSPSSSSSSSSPSRRSNESEMPLRLNMAF